MTKRRLPDALPHGPLEELFDGVWFCRGTVRMPGPIKVTFARSMTVIRADDGDLTVVNSMRLTEPGLRELEALGKVTRVIRLAGFHGSDDAFYQERYGAKLFSVVGQKYFTGFNPKKGEEYMQADGFLDEESPLPVRNATLKVISSSRPPEGFLLLERDGGILICGDALQNMPAPDEYTNLIASVSMRMIGFYKPYNVGPGWLGGAKPLAQDVRSLLDLEFEHVLPVHGLAVIGDAKAKFRPAIEGPLKGAR